MRHSIQTHRTAAPSSKITGDAELMHELSDRQTCTPRRLCKAMTTRQDGALPDRIP